MQKGMSTVVSAVLVILISVVAITAVVTVGLPLIDKIKEAAVVEEGQKNMAVIDNMIRQTATEGLGIVRSAQISVTDGTYRTNDESETFDYDLVLKSDALQKGTFTRSGNLLTTVTGISSASQNSTSLIIENEILEAVFDRVGSESSFASVNTSTVLRSLRMKQTGMVIIPNDTSVIVSNQSTTSWGTGYTRLSQEGSQLVRAEVKAHVRSAFSGVEYEVFYTLPGSSDFLVIQVRNVSNNRTTFTYSYKLGFNSSNDVIRMGNFNESLFTVVSYSSVGGGGGGSSAENQTINLDNANWTRNSSSITVAVGNGTVYYNASDGSLRNVSELSEIGQGNWSYSSNSTHTFINYTLAGSDGYEFGVRDSAVGGSYWLNRNGTLYGRVNVSNDFITVGMTENDLKIYNSSRKLIFNTSFDGAVKVDGQNLISLYGSGTQNKTVYFFDWASQAWRRWTNANTTAGLEEYFSSYASQGAADANWISTDTGVARVNVTGGYIDHTFVADTTDNSISYDLGNVSNTSWVLRFKMKFTSLSSDRRAFIGVGSSNTTNQAASQDFIGMNIVHNGAPQWSPIDADGAALPTGVGDAYTSYTFSTNVDYYVEIRRTDAISYSVGIFNDPTYSGLVGTGNGSAATTTQSLRYLKFQSEYDTRSGTMVARIDDVKFWNGVASVPSTGMPNWLDQRNKQAFKWRYAFSGINQPQTNITFLVNSHDPFVRTFVDVEKEFSPADLSGLYVWYDASDGSTVTKDASNRVSQWNDKSGNNFHLSQSTGGSQPLLLLSDQNGRNSVDFSGSRYMVNSTPMTVAAQPNTVFMAARMPSSGGGNVYMYDSDKCTSPHRHVIVHTNNADQYNMGIGANLIFTATTSDNTWQYTTWVTNGASSLARFGGVQQTSGDVGSGDFSGITFGAGCSQAQPSNNKFGEFIAFNRRLSTEEIIKVESYLARKWGMQPVVNANETSHNVTLVFSLPENRTSVTTAEPGLVGYWNFNEGQGTNVSDVSGNGRTGRLTNGPSWVSNSSCVFGNCMSFDGSNDYVDAQFTWPSGDFSVETWVNPRAWGISPDHYQRIFHFYDGSQQWQALADPSYGFSFDNTGATGAETSINGNVPKVGTWTHVVLVKSGSSYLIYFNGTAQPTISPTVGNPTPTTQTLRIGADIAGTGSNGHFNGMIDGFRIYSRALDISEIKQLYYTGLNQQKPGIYFTKNNATDNEEVLFSATNWRNVNRSNFQVLSNQTNVFGFNWTFNSTQNNNFMFALGTMGRMNTTTFNPAGNATQFSIETMESVANSTLTWYDISNVREYFQDDFSAYGDQSEADASWPSTNTVKSRVNVAQDVINSTLDRSASNDHSIYHDMLTNVSDTSWVMRWKYTVNVVASNNVHIDFGLSDRNSAYTTGTDSIHMHHVSSAATPSDNRVYVGYSEAPNNPISGGVLSSGEPDSFSEPSAGVTYYFELTRDPASKVTLNQYSDQSYRSLVASNRLHGVPSTVNGLRYMKLGVSITDGLGPTPANVSIDDIYFWNNVSSVQNYNGTSVASGTVRHIFGPTFNYDGGAAGVWRLDEGGGLNAIDSSGNGNVGTLMNGPTWISNSSCRHGACLYLSSAGSNFVKIRNNQEMNNIQNSIVTFEAWIKTTGSGGYIFSSSDDLTTGFQVYQNGVNLAIWSNGGSSLVSSSATNDGNWHHIAGVWDGTNGKIYMDGDMVLSAARTISTSNSATFTNEIGTHCGGADGTSCANYYNGYIDDVRIYRRALTDVEVRDHYQREVTRYYDDFGTAASGKTYRYFGVEDSNTTLQPVTPKDVVLHLRFDDNSTTNVTDSSGRGNGGRTVNGPLWITNSSCKFEGCISVDGSNDYVDTKDNIFGNVNVTTVSFWVYPRALTGTGEDRVVSNDYTIFGYNNAGQASVLMQTSSGGAYRAKTTNPIVQTGRWHHLTYVFNGLGSTDAEKIKIYLNGSEQAMTVDNSPFPVYIFDSGATVGIGSDDIGVINSAYARANAIVDEVLITNRTLNANEVYQLYLGGANRTINGKWHRVAAVEGIQSMSFNLTDHNNTLDGQDYDMRYLFVNATSDGGEGGGSGNATENRTYASSACYTPANVSQQFLCSYDGTEFSENRLSGIVYAGDRQSFVTMCNDQTSNQTEAPYKFNVTAYGQQKVILPFSRGACGVVGNKTGVIERQQIPATTFGPFDLRGPSNLQLSLQYDKIKILGDARFSKGTYSVCARKVGQDSNRVIINVTVC